MGTFYGLEMARKALFAQQSAIYTTGHNIANANTEGYSRQRVNFQTTTPFPMPSRVQPQIAGQMGTGVKVGAVQRIRDQFLDAQYRAENSKLGYWQTKSTSFSRMENLLNEPSEHGLSHVMDEFWQSLNELSVHPDNTGARKVVAERGLAVAETFNYLSKNLKSIQGDLKSQINAMAGADNESSDINSILRQINAINMQVQKLEPHGYVANDLYDDRDRLIDQLSEMVNIKVHRSESAKSALAIADGVVSIELLDESGTSFDEPIYLLNARDADDIANAVNEVKVTFDNGTGAVSDITLTNTEEPWLIHGNSKGDDWENQQGSEPVPILNRILESTGSLKALISANGYTIGEGEDKETIGDYPKMLDELNKLAKAFADKFNEVHAKGMDLNGDYNEYGDDGELIGENKIADFFEVDSEDAAGTLTVNDNILKNPDLIAAGLPKMGSRNGENALNLADVFEYEFKEEDAVESDEDHPLKGTSISKFFASLIGDVGVQAQEANRMKTNTDILHMQIDHERMSVSAVSLDEEFSNLIKFQHAYNAAARNMTAIDEMIDRIINNMGIVGR